MKYKEPNIKDYKYSPEKAVGMIESRYENLFDEFTNLVKKANDDSLYNTFTIEYMQECCRKEASIGKGYCDFEASLPFKPATLAYFEENGLGISHSIVTEEDTYTITIFW